MKLIVADIIEMLFLMYITQLKSICETNTNLSPVCNSNEK